MNKSVVVGTLFLLFSVLGCASSDSENPTSALEGDWEVIQHSEKGKSRLSDKLQMFVKIHEQKWVPSFRGSVIVMSDGPSAIRIDDSKQPGHIDLTLLTGAKAGKVQPGIYAIEQGQLKVALGELGGKRPEYVQADNAATFMILKRKE